MSHRRRYLNFTTPSGVSLATVAQSGCSSFLLHDTGYLKALNNWNHPGVDSPFWRFYHNRKPGSWVHCQGKNWPLEPDKVVLIPANTIFDCCGPVETEHFWIHFTVNRLAGQGLELRPHALAVDKVLGALLERVLQVHRDQGHPLRLQRLHHLTSALLHASFSQLEEPLLSEHPERLAELLALIDQAPHTDLSNAFLAGRAGMSTERFIRWFRQHTQQTPAAYVMAARTRQAQQLLALSDKTIDQVSAETGFANRHYFSRVFARQVGCGPAEFRKRQRERKGL